MKDNGNFSIGIVSGKLGGVDGVSLEVDKWIDVLHAQGHEVYTIAGYYVQPLRAVSEAHRLDLPEITFTSDFQKRVEMHVFPHMTSRPVHLNSTEMHHLVEEIEARGREVGESLHEMIRDNGIDVLIGQNTNAMPMTILGGVAMYYVATTKRMATIFHHHDFWWERSRFSNSRIETLLNAIMPPVDLGLEHVVISSYAAHILSSLKRVQPHIIPNCENFDSPVTLDDYNGEFRNDFGFRDDDILVVQPTRIVPRKRIEDSVELVAALSRRYPDIGRRLHYIISLYQGDEPDEDYIERIRRTAERTGVRLHMISDRVRSSRSVDESGRRYYTNRDVLANADVVTYLPIWEGFGNALLESIAARVPVVTTTYLVYKTDIMTSGLRNIEVRDRYDENGRLLFDDALLDQIHHILTHRDERREMVENNFLVGAREYGLGRLRERLDAVFSSYGDEIRASRKRLSKSMARYSV